MNLEERLVQAEKDREAIDKNINELKQEIERSKKTYSVGQRIMIQAFDSTFVEYIVAQISSKLVAAISLDSGNRWRNPMAVVNAYKITEDEMNIMIGCNKFYLKKQIEDNDKKFYIGDKFTSGNTVYQLIKHDNKVALVIVEGHQSDIGVHTRGGWSEIPVKTEKRNRKFVKNLPTIYPNVFGLDKKYGWYG